MKIIMKTVTDTRIKKRKRNLWNENYHEKVCFFCHENNNELNVTKCIICCGDWGWL